MKLIKLGDILHITSGGTPSRSNLKYYENGTIPWVKTGDLRQKYIEDTPEKITQIGLEHSSAKLFPPRTLLIAMYGATIGQCAILKNESATNQACAALLPHKSYNEEFLYYYFKSIKRTLISMGQGGGQPNISATILKSMKIPILDLNNQIRIAKVLTKAEQLIAKRKESIHLLDEVIKSTFLDMFGDPRINEKDFDVVSLEAMCEKIVDCPHSTPIKSDYKTEYACIRTSELKKGYIRWDSMQYVNIEEYQKRIQRLVPEEGDVIYGREGSFGEAIKTPETPKFCLGQRTMLFRPDKKTCNSIFLWAMVRSDYVYSQALRKNSGSTVGHVNVKDIKKFKVLCPPLILQNKFAKIIEKIESIKTKYQTSLTELENLYGSLSQRAFKGELDLSGVEVENMGKN